MTLYKATANGNIPMTEEEEAEFEASREPSLASVKSAKLADIKKWAAEADLTYFPHDGKNFSASTYSRSQIDGVTLYLLSTDEFPPNYPGGWQDINEDFYQINTKTGFIAFYESMVHKGAANFAHAEELKALVNAATTIEEVAAIVW